MNADRIKPVKVKMMNQEILKTSPNLLKTRSLTTKANATLFFEEFAQLPVGYVELG